MDSVINIIREAILPEQKHDLSHLEDENELRHPFHHPKGSFDCNDYEEIIFSQVHNKTHSTLGDDSDDSEWHSLDEYFENLRINHDIRYELSSNIKNHLKSMLFKPDLNIKSKESFHRKYSSSSSSGSKFKQDRKSSVTKGENLRGMKGDRKLSVLFNIKRKKSSFDESLKKKIEESTSKINKMREDVGSEKGRKCSVGEMKNKEKDLKEGSRKCSTVSENVTRRSSKKLELNVHDFLISSPRYNHFEDKNEQQLDKNFISWSSKERSRKRVTNWMNKYLS